MASGHLAQLFVEFFKANPSQVLTNLVFLFITPVQDVVLPHFYGKIMDAIRLKKDVVKPISHALGLLVAIQVVALIGDYHDSKLFPAIQSFIRESIVARVLENYETQHTELEMGEVITKIVKVPTTMTDWFERMKSYIIPYFIVFIMAVIYFTYHDVQMGVALAIVLLAFSSVLLVSPFTCSDISQKSDQCFNDIHEKIDDVFRNLFSIYGANHQAHELKKLRELMAEFGRRHQETISCVLKFKVWVTPLVIGFMVFFVYRSYILITSRRMKPSTFVPMFIILLYILNAMIILNDLMRDIVVEWGIIESSSDIIARIPQKVQRVEGRPHIPPQEGIGMAGITFTYPGSEQPTLPPPGVSLHIAKGERAVIVGDIGSGKSTIIKLLLKYHIPDAGYIYLNGVDYRDIPVWELRRHIGYVPQHPILFNRSILENILYGNEGRYGRKDVEALLDAFGLSQEFARAENGLNTVIGKNGSKLSGGQRQLVWCLRVIMSDPEIIVLDEPTASIDEKTKEALHRMLEHLMKGKTVIMITHDPFLVDIATRKIVMHQGAIATSART